MNEEFYSRAKLLLTGEYFVLEGSLALALPLKLGQSMTVKKIKDSRNELIWETNVKDKLWFSAKYGINDINIIDTSDEIHANYIQRLLLQIRKLSNILSDNSIPIKILTNLEFPVHWGLGSSSSLISNLANWAKVNPYDLFYNTMEGSGYDIAASQSNGPILYQLKNGPKALPIQFEPDFLDKIYFVYLGKKQNTLTSVLKNKKKIIGKSNEVDIISQLTKSIVQSKTLEEFEGYINRHEEIVSECIKEEIVKSKYFSDFKGSIKSLGAWGGDFILATHSGSIDFVKDYFGKKGLEVIFSYKDLVL